MAKKKTTEEMEAMLDDTEEDVEEMVKESKSLPNWIGKKKDRLTGQYLRVKRGFIYTFKVDLDTEPQEVEKDFQGNGEFKVRHQWPIYLQKVSPTAIGRGLQEEDEEAYDKVMKQNEGVGEEFIFEMSTNVDTQLAAFIHGMDNPRGNIKLQRKGEGMKTKYHFSEE